MESGGWCPAARLEASALWHRETLRHRHSDATNAQLGGDQVPFPMTRNAAELVLLSRLLDEGLDLAPEDRMAWIDALSGEAEPLKAQLRRLLAQSPPPIADASELIRREVHAAVAASAQSAHPEELHAAARIGPYELVHEIGRGGMATVWLARRVEGLVGRRVALKLPHAGWSGAHLADRIAREREILEKLDHPHIARISDAGVTARGQPWLALEYIEGLPITEHCDNLHLGLRDRLRLFMQVLGAVQYAHSNLIIHRDLKPANILVTAEGTAVVLDFGIAKLLTEGLSVETALTQLGGRALTLDYASPEQIAGLPLTTASDVYSLGAILYELLTGQRPYRLTRSTAGELEEAILSADIRKPSVAALELSDASKHATTPPKLRAALRGDLDTIVLTALHRRLVDRYQTADALALEIQRYLDNRPINARAANSWENSRRFVARNKLAVGAAAAVAVALCLGSGVALWQAQVARTESEKQKASRDFVVGLFESVADNTPAGLSPADATAKQMLDLGTRQLFLKYSGDSAIRLDLLMLMGSLSENLDLLDSALKIMDESVALAARLYGVHDARYFEALEAKAEVLVSKGEYAKAVALADSVVERIGPVHADTSAVYSKAEILLGNLHNLIDPPESPESRRHLELALAALTAEHSRTEQVSRANFYIARTWESVGDYARAEAYYRDGIAAAERNFGKSTYIAAFGYLNFGDMLRHVHRFREAESYLLDAGSTFKGLYGSQYVRYAETQVDLGLVFFEQGEFHAADQSIGDGIANVIAAEGEHSSDLLPMRIHQARLKLAMGDLSDANAIYDAILTSPAARDPSNRRLNLITGLEQAKVLILLDKLAEADTLINQSTAGFAGTLDAHSIQAIRLDLRQGELRLAKNDAAGARDRFKAALDLTLELGGAATAQLPEVLFAYTQVMPGPEDARATLARVNPLQLVRSTRAGEPMSIDDSVRMRAALGRLEEASGNLGAAGLDLREALRLRTAHEAAPSVWLAELDAMMAEYYSRSGDLVHARAELAKAERILDSLPAYGSWFRRRIESVRAGAGSGARTAHIG